MKKVLIVFMLIFSLSFFCGCQQNEFDVMKDFVYSGVTFNKDGSVSQSVGLSVNSEKIMSLTNNADITVQFQANLIKNLDLLRQKFLLNFALKYIENPIEKFKIGSGVVLSSTYYNQDADMVSFEMVFSSLSSWQYYHGGISENAQEKQKMPLLICKKSSTSQFPFSGQDGQGQSLTEEYKKIFLSACKGLSIESQLAKDYHPSFVYCYGTYLEKIKSDCDYRIESQGTIYHIWSAKENQLEGKTTTIYYHLINFGNWLLIALVVPIFGLVGYLLGYKLIKTKKTKYINNKNKKK